jgi:hypothetical protein
MKMKKRRLKARSSSCESENATQVPIISPPSTQTSCRFLSHTAVPSLPMFTNFPARRFVRRNVAGGDYRTGAKRPIELALAILSVEIGRFAPVL